MRGPLLPSLFLAGFLALAGCGSGGSDETGSTSPTTTTSGTGGGGTTGTAPTNATTTTAPNLPPILRLRVTDAGGNATNATLVGGSLTFDASGSADQDSDGLSAIAITVTDSNKTHPPATLYSGGRFAPATFTFDRAGPVNVTVSGLDNRGGLAALHGKVFVNQKESRPSKTFPVPLAATEDAADCHGPTDNENTAAADNAVWERLNFPVAAGAQYVVATLTAGTGEIALCAPDGTAISASSPTSVTSNKGTAFTVPEGTQSYYVSVYGGGNPNTGVTVETVIHYDPQP